MRDGKIADVGYHPPFNMLFSSSEFEYGDLVDLESRNKNRSVATKAQQAIVTRSPRQQEDDELVHGDAGPS